MTEQESLAAQAAILLSAAKERKEKPFRRNKDGSINGTAVHGFTMRYRRRLQKEAGCGHNEAYYLMRDLMRGA